MWIYAQRSGALSRNGQIVARGYSGHADGKNNPVLQDVANVGPIPRGLYTIGAPDCVKTSGPHGPYVLPLTPDPTNRMNRRSHFLIHGDALSDPGDASTGCIILGRLVREAIAASDDHRLQVVEDLFNDTVKA